MYDENEFRQSRLGKLVRLVAVATYVTVAIGFAMQTYELVDWLFPGDNWFMKSVAMFVCDPCAIGYSLAEMFYRFRLRDSKELCYQMFWVAFAFSTVASVIQMYLGSTHNIPHRIDPNIVAAAYGLFILAFVVHLVAIAHIIRQERAAGQPKRRYLDDPKPQRTQSAHRPSAQTARRVAPPARVAVTQVTQPPVRRPVRHLPARRPAQSGPVVEESQTDVSEEQEVTDEEETEEEEAEETPPPLSERLTLAKNALFSPRSGNRK